MKRIVKKFEERRAEIVKTARDLFEVKEYENTTMQDIMDALGIAKGTIYHYFKAKEELLEAVIEDIVNQNSQEIENLIQNVKGSALEKMQMLIQANNMSKKNKNILDYLHKPNNAVLHSRILAAILIKQAPLYAALIEQGCKEGIFNTASPLESAEFILAGVQFLADVGIYPWKEEDLNRRIKAFPKLIEQQLQAPAGSFQFLAKRMQTKP